MAEGRKEIKKVTKTVEVETEQVVYVMELTLDELKALRAVCNKVAGDMVYSPRAHIESLSDGINKMLGLAKYDWAWAVDATSLVSGSLRFDRYPSDQ